jgi:hypothetical protein
MSTRTLPLSEWRYGTVPTEPLSRTRIMVAVHDLTWKPSTSAGYGIAAAALYPANPGGIKECSYFRFTSCCWSN